MSEDRLLRWLRARLASPRIGVPQIGDDAAVLPAGGPFAVTVDSQIAGVHFVPDLDPALLAPRLLAVNLSDVAAMGAVPTYAFLALSTLPDFDHRRFFRSLLTACQKHRVTLAGGDLARGAQTVATLTLIGSRPEGARFLHRSDAAAGHDLWLGGTIGESAAGQRLIARGARLRQGRVELPTGFEAKSSTQAAARRAVRRHLLPEPQLALGAWLGLQPEGAAMDVSDGLAKDLRRLCHESGAGAEIVAEDLPFADRFIDLCRSIAADPFDLALGGGEDYVLLFTLPSGIVPPAELGARRIGRITRSKEIVLRRGGAVGILPEIGWDHLTGEAEAR